MPDKPQSAAGYQPSYSAKIEAVCLYLATKLGDFSHELVVVGGLVPTLLIPPANLAEGTDAHVGTIDLDLGMHLAILDGQRYRALSKQLRTAGLSPDRNEQGKETFQRWTIDSITVDFLISPNSSENRGGRLFHLEEDLAALVAPGLQLAFLDRLEVPLRGTTILGETATRNISVCGPGAYIVLKSLAFRNRGEGKDAYDLYFVIRNFGAGVPDVAKHLKPLLEHPETQLALDILRQDFSELDGIGPRRVANFWVGPPDVTIQSEVVAFISLLLRLTLD